MKMYLVSEQQLNNIGRLVGDQLTYNAAVPIIRILQSLPEAPETDPRIVPMEDPKKD